MTTGNITMNFPAAVAGSTGVGSPLAAGLDGVGMSPEAFLQALMAQLQGSAPSAGLAMDGEAVSQMLADESVDQASKVAFLEQLKSLAEQSGLQDFDLSSLAALNGGNSADGNGKLLPTGTEEAMTIDDEANTPLTPEELAQMMAQWANQGAQTPMPTVAQGEGDSSVNEAGLALDEVASPLAETDATALTVADTLAASVAAAAQTASASLLVNRESLATDAHVDIAAPAASQQQTLNDALTKVTDQADALADLVSGPALPGTEKDARLGLNVAGSQEAVVAVESAPTTPAFAVAPAPGTAPAAELKRATPAAMEKPVGQPGWPEELSERVIWMAGKGLQSAELRLNPEHLGPLQIRIQIQQDQATIQFTSDQSKVREAIELAVPQLKEMLSGQQPQWAEINVSQQSFAEHREQQAAQFQFEQQKQQGKPGQPATASDDHESSIRYPDMEGQPAVRAGKGLLSLYA